MLNTFLEDWTGRSGGQGEGGKWELAQGRRGGIVAMLGAAVKFTDTVALL